MDQKLVSPKLCEEEIHQLTAKKIPIKATCQNNRMIDSFLYMQKTQFFLIICPKKYLILTKKWSPNFNNIYIYIFCKFLT